MSSLRVVWHLAEPCPAWLKQAWIDWLGPEKIVELYGGTEGQLACVINGVEWLEHRGSVGRPMTGEIMICDADGNEVPVGEDGEVWLRSRTRHADLQLHRRRSAPARRRLGVARRQRLGRRRRLPLSRRPRRRHDPERRRQHLPGRGRSRAAGASVDRKLRRDRPARRRPGQPHPRHRAGRRVDAFDEADVLAFLAERLVRYKLPRSFEVVNEPLRDDAGKVRRSDLKAQRV